MAWPRLKGGNWDSAGGDTLFLGSREVIGLQALLTIDTEQHRLRVGVDREIAPKEGSSLRLLPAESRLHLFDQATELAMSVWIERRLLRRDINVWIFGPRRKPIVAP